MPADLSQPADSGLGFALGDEFPSWLAECSVDWNALPSPFTTDVVPLGYNWSDLSSISCSRSVQAVCDCIS